MAQRRTGRSRGQSPRASRGPQAAQSPRRVVAFGLIGFVSLVVALAVAGGSLSIWARTARGSAKSAIAVRVLSPDVTPELVEGLAELGGVDSAWMMRLYLLTLGRMGDLATGAHLLPANASPRVIAQCLCRTPSRPTTEVLIPEGFDHVRVGKRLEERGVCQADEFVAMVRDKSAIVPLGIVGPDAEGYLFPATYRLAVDSAPNQLLERFVVETRARLRKLDQRLGGNRLGALSTSRNWGEHEVLTLASMIEKEARLDEERPIIASVFFNRLDSTTFRPLRMLQSDPTAGYGCLVQGERIPSCAAYRQRILPVMLRDSQNPYNTYRHPGLPPGPIASPGEASIESVLSPASTPYLFFVSTGEGRHSFSRDLEEHQARTRGKSEQQTSTLP